LPLCIVISLSWIVVAGIYGWKKYSHLEEGYQVSVSGKILSMNEWWEYDGIDEPLYRLDRTGKPAQVLNVQWAGSIDNIKANLITHGWHIAPNTLFDAILERINKSPKTEKKIELPVVPPLYLEQHPVLVMTKNLESPDRLLLLSLWNSKTQFTNVSLPLWLGN